MTATRWIGPDENLTIGQIGFLINYSNAFRDSDSYDLDDTPACANNSGRPTLAGWCGTYNGTATYACGMVIVEKLTPNGRALVRQLTNDELPAALEQFGYPELMPNT